MSGDMTSGSGRESRQAADAVAGLLALALVSSMMVVMLPRGALAQGLALPLSSLRPPRLHNMTCDDVPYPFGVRGKSLPGFEVTCGPAREAVLRIGGRGYRISFVSVPGSYVVIYAGPICQECYDRNSNPTPPSAGTGAAGLTSLEGTPFTFSKSNRLVNVGCNRSLIATFAKPPIPWPSASCTTWCNGTGDTICSGSCLGRACCQVPIPEQVNGARQVTVSFRRTASGNATPEEYGTCSGAFFLGREEEVFSFKGGNEGEKPLKEALLPLGERRMVLDWAIGNATCDQAQSYTLAPLCNGDACVDAPSGAGYLCRCRDGYYGNPYAADGCEDIDECRDTNSNNCTYLDFCHNIPGGYTCSCPDSYIGDGYRTGTGCNATLPPSGSPSRQQQQGTNLCHSPEKNPCTYISYCNDDQGVALCTCPGGMSGDGQKTGSGCKRHFPPNIILGVGFALMATVTATTSCYCWARKKRELGRKKAKLFRKNGGLLLQHRFSTITSQDENQSAKIFSAEELKIATDNYSESRILGRGGHGTVYKGILPDKTLVAIKKAKVFDESQVEQFINEITILSHIDHPNVVKLLGCCLETEVPLLVYEYIPNGTLFQHIHSRNVPSPLSWEDGLRIAAEIAEALGYLHSTSFIPIIHRDIKSSNILLDKNYVAKIADFGASRSVPFDQTHITTLIQGTIGYLDPEYFQTSQLTEKSDVYSFGVVLAELLTRQKPISATRPDESCNLAMYLVILFNEGRLLQEIGPRMLAEAGEEQCYAVAELAVRCLNVKGEERPAMKEVASILDGLRRSFTAEQTIRRKDMLIQKNNEQGEEQLLHESRPIPSLQSSKLSTQCSMDAEMLPSSQIPR